MPAAAASTGAQNPQPGTLGEGSRHLGAPGKRSRPLPQRGDGAGEGNSGGARGVRGGGQANRARGSKGVRGTLTHLFHLDLFVVDFFEVEDRGGFPLLK